jgi:hypothetical protein
MEMGRSVVEGAVTFSAEVGVDEHMLVSGMEALSRFENMKFVGRVGVQVEQGFEIKVRDAMFILGVTRVQGYCFVRVARPLLCS